MIARALAIWLALAAVAFANGTFRVVVLTRPLGEDVARVVSTILLAALILALSWASIRWIAPGSASDALAVGLLWLVLTVAFEFALGRLVSHKPWTELLADYNVLRGRIWPLALLVIAVAPYFTARWRQLF